MSETKLIKEQQQFIDWLKSKGIYNPMESAYTMKKMHIVWKTLKKDHTHDKGSR